MVRDSISGLAVPGAVIAALDSAGTGGVRTIADEFGRFSLDVPAGPARLRVIRIGFEPRTVAVPASAPARAAGIEIRMLALPALLTQVHVSDRSICPGSEDRSGALALWDQARAGLLAAVVARQSKPGNMKVLEYSSDEEPDSRLVIRQTTRTTTGTTGRPFVAVRAAEGFARQGYMARDGGTLTFFAPDADVLLDQEFAATHCFRVVRDDGHHPNEVGLSFEPAPGSHPDGFVDVDGTLWMDSDHPALRTLDFAYTGLDPAYRSAGTGGRLVFRNMTNGLVYIERWSMHLPAVAALAAPGHQVPAGRYAGVTPGEIRNVHVVQWHDLGGDVLAARWPDGSHAESTLGAVTGLVRDRNGAPLPGVHVMLDRTQTAATTDTTGRFTMWPVLPGRYGLDAVDSAYAAFVDPRRASQTISVGRDTLAAPPIVLSSRQQAVAGLCGDRSAPPTGTAIILGQLRSPAPLGPELRVEGSWTVQQLGDATAAHRDSIRVTPGDDGGFILCHVPLDPPLALRLVRRDSTLADTTVKLGRGSVQTMEWRVGGGR
ncbi:MAG TPA: carboxypeptidase-like regulatory domain-containing protein [Gemmatimonadaceae bacterium]